MVISAIRRRSGGSSNTGFAIGNTVAGLVAVSRGRLLLSPQPAEAINNMPSAVVVQIFANSCISIADIENLAESSPRSP